MSSLGNFLVTTTTFSSLRRRPGRPAPGASGVALLFGGRQTLRPTRQLPSWASGSYPLQSPPAHGLSKSRGHGHPCPDSDQAPSDGALDWTPRSRRGVVVRPKACVTWSRGPAEALNATKGRWRTSVLHCTISSRLSRYFFYLQIYTFISTSIKKTNILVYVCCICWARRVCHSAREWRVFESY